MRHIILTICLLAAFAEAFSKGIIFEELEWDFGTLNEEDAPIAHTYRFKNDESNPIVIHNVRTSCGCTSTEYSRKPIAAGESSTITVSFDPRYQEGSISKSIYIYSTAPNSPSILTLRGTVTPRVRSFAERYPYALGKGGYIGMLFLTIPAIKRDEIALSSIEYANNSDLPIEVEFTPRHDSKELKIFYDQGMAANSRATVEIGYFIERRLKADETLRDTIDIYVNGEKTTRSLYIKGLTTNEH